MVNGYSLADRIIGVLIFIMSFLIKYGQFINYNQKYMKVFFFFFFGFKGKIFRELTLLIDVIIFFHTLCL